MVLEKSNEILFIPKGDILMNIINTAITFAAKAHINQRRKGTDIPYITHPFAVGMMLQKAQCSEEVIAAGILHDTLEDTNVTYNDIVETFGVRVAKLVQAASEHNKSLPWEARKQHTINMLKDISSEELQVIVADKLHNLQSIEADFQANGDSIWQRFNRGKRDQHWYYASIVKALSSRKKEFKLIRELEREVKNVFGSLKIVSDYEISLLFSCAYLYIEDDIRKKLEAKQLIRIAESLVQESDTLYRQSHHDIMSKLEDLHARGIEFQSNSDGPFILGAFCIALQNKMQWSNEELFKHFQKNASKL